MKRTPKILAILTLRKLAHAMKEIFLALKIENFQLKIFDIFLIFAQNIDCGYTLEPPYYIKVGYKGVLRIHCMDMLS